MKKLFFILLASLALFSTSCKEDDPVQGSVEVNIVHQIDGDNLVANEIQYDSPAGHKFSVTTIRYYISRVQLLKEGDDFELKTYHYVDLDDSNTFRFNISNVAPGKYDKLKLTFGIEREDNAEGLLANTVANQNMLWPTQLRDENLDPSGDYHYMKYEGRFDSLNTGVVKTYKIHLGPTMGNDNSFDVTLPISEVDVNGNSWSIDLNVDMLEWLKDPEVYSYHQFGAGIMPKQHAQEFFKANGPSVFTIGSVTKK